jgi:hypothetical protein
MTGEIVARIVRALERYYRVEAEDVRPFVRTHDDEALREVLLVREEGEDVELGLVLPERLASARTWTDLGLDERCQIVEGASHFLMVCARAKSARPTTHLELELQAEVDKWLILSGGGRLDAERDAELRDALFDDPTFLHPPSTTEGARYRLASSAAARFVHKLSRTYVRAGRLRDLRVELVRWFHASQEEKLRAAVA